MADKTLQRLKRRDLLQMLLVQCEETERLQTELCELKAQMETVMESYERLKKKLDIKDERLNQKDERIKELGGEIERLKKTGEAEPEAALVDAAHRLNEIFKEAQQAAEQYLTRVEKRHGIKAQPAGPEERHGFPGNEKTSAVRRKQGTPHIRQIIEVHAGRVSGSREQNGRSSEDTGVSHRVTAAVSGDFYG